MNWSTCLFSPGQDVTKAQEARTVQKCRAEKEKEKEKEKTTKGGAQAAERREDRDCCYGCGSGCGCGIRARKKGASGGPGAAILPTPLLLRCPLSDLSRTGSMYQQRGVGLDVGAMQPSPIAYNSGGVGGRNHPL